VVEVALLSMAVMVINVLPFLTYYVYPVHDEDNANMYPIILISAHFSVHLSEYIRFSS
jgi:hypothetical protein